MRISDWSSDVCSSDLLEDDLAHVEAIGFRVLAGRVEAAQFVVMPVDRRVGHCPELRSGLSETGFGVDAIACNSFDPRLERGFGGGGKSVCDLDHGYLQLNPREPAGWQVR